jgi:hypothetical protein
MSTSKSCAVLLGTWLALGSPLAAEWPLPEGAVQPEGPAERLVGITFDEPEFVPGAQVDGLSLSTIDGQPLSAPLSFNCADVGGIDPECDIDVGPGTQQFVAGLGIEAKIDSVLSIDFGEEVSAVSFGFALECAPPVSPGVTVRTFDTEGSLIDARPVDAIDTGFAFAEGFVAIDDVALQSINLSFNGSTGCAAWFVDNLLYENSQPDLAIPTLGFWGVLAFAALLAGAALLRLLPRWRRA